MMWLDNYAWLKRMQPAVVFSLGFEGLECSRRLIPRGKIHNIRAGLPSNQSTPGPVPYISTWPSGHSLTVPEVVAGANSLHPHVPAQQEDGLAQWTLLMTTPVTLELWQVSRLSAATQLASFPGCRGNGLATSASSNCYFCCLKVDSTNQIPEHSHMTNCVMHWAVAVTPIPLQ